ncbi:Dbl homology domain-containing protein [Ceratobasidium sp. AG-I]|nr:Dbl homology domain-containing protein [Ceratobasidium sp. AG-I]
MIIEDNERGWIVDANSRTVFDLGVPFGTAHLLLAHDPTPSLLPGFLCVALPQISTTLLRLDISVNLLHDLPPALSACIHLEELNVSSNPLRSLPSLLGALTSLQVLIADDCELSSLPTQLVHLSALHSLSVRFNRFVMLPVWMCYMPSLEVLKLEGNAFSGPWEELVAPLLTLKHTHSSNLVPVTRASAMDPVSQPSAENTHARTHLGPPPGRRQRLWGLLTKSRSGRMGSHSNTEVSGGALLPANPESTPSIPAREEERKEMLQPTNGREDQGGEGAENDGAAGSKEVQNAAAKEDHCRAAEEADSYVDEEATRSYTALQGVMSYLRDLADLGGATNDGSMPDGWFASNSASTASLRSGRASVLLAGSNYSYGDVFAECRVHKDDKEKRAEIIKEIIDTEKLYVTGLQELVDIYVTPASEPAPGLNIGRETTVPPQERKIVFLGVDSLLQFHKQSFLPSLISAARGLDFGADTDGQLSTMAAHEIAKVFVPHAAFMKMYLTYINNLDNAIQRLQYWSGLPSMSNASGSATPAPTAHAATLNTGQRKRIRAFLKQCWLHPRHSQLNLEGYLLLPIQRIPGYMMLLDKLVMCMPPRPDGAEDPLDLALEEVRALTLRMNQGRRDSESRSQLIQWQSQIQGKFLSPLVQPHRRFILQGKLQLVRLVKQANVSVECPDGLAGQVELPCLSSNSDPKDLVALLCNDLLVLCKDLAVTKAGSQLPLWAVLRIQKMVQPASLLFGNILRIVDNKAILYFNTPSTSDALAWQQAINLHIPHS